MKLWYLVSTLVAVYCRPQNAPQNFDGGVEKTGSGGVEVETKPNRQTLFQNGEKKVVVDNTKEILEKIAEVNRNHGFSLKGLKADHDVRVPALTQPPYSPYFRSQDYLKQQEKEYQQKEYQQNPFINPILEYLQKMANRDSNDDEIPGQYVKRRITHSQTLIVPTFLPPSYIPMQIPNQPPTLTKNQSITNNTLLEKQTVDNIKNIVVGYQPFYPYHNYFPYQNPYYQYQIQNPALLRQQITSPFGEFFPIVIKDPIMQMLNAFTSMIEYGQQGSTPNKCKNLEETVDGPNQKDLGENLDEDRRFGKLLPPPNDKKVTINYNVQNKDENPEITIFGPENPNLPPENELNQTVLDIEDLQISNNDEDPVQFTYHFKADSFDWVNRDRDAKVVKKETKRVTVIKPGSQSSRGSPPNRDHPPEIEEDDFPEPEVILDSEISKDDQKNHETTNKKLISKDNTGSGIFIHKLKVRKGGVAIAGPGGIATAGSGGTAIVGPNGFAYTHPDSIAIAGSGSQVIAVDPQISLSDIVQGQNKTRKDGSRPRVGKVVAVGPVIYYNKGQDN